MIGSSTKRRATEHAADAAAGLLREFPRLPMGAKTIASAFSTIFGRIGSPGWARQSNIGMAALLRGHHGQRGSL
jgi:hypothetical protein